MNFTKLAIDYPEIFKTVDERMEKLQAILKEKRPKSALASHNSVDNSIFYSIAGGAPCNHYMNLPIRDIDVFINDYSLKKEDIEQAFESEVEVLSFKEHQGYDDFIDVPYLFKLTIDDLEIEIIPCSINKVFEFDTRFRQFYCHKGEIYATKEAIEDIEQKRLVIVNPATPTSSLFRLIRFSEQLGFTIDEKSEQFVKWAFQHMPKSKKDYLEYAKKRRHKMSEEGFKKFLAFAEDNTKIVNRYALNEETNRWELKDSLDVFPKDPVFPFHPSLEKSVIQHLDATNRYWKGTLALVYNFLESFEPLQKTFSLTLDERAVREKTLLLAKKLKSQRVRYVANGLPLSEPFPTFSNWKHFLKNDFLKPLTEKIFSLSSDYYYNDSMIFYTSGIDLLGKEVTVNITSLENGHRDPMNSDILSHTSLKLTINDRLHYLLRKCENGKYTISDIFSFDTSNGEGFYLEVIGKALKEQYPEWFDFNNPELKGIFHFVYGSTTMKEFYFSHCIFNEIPLNESDILREVSMDSNNLKHETVLQRKSS